MNELQTKYDSLITSIELKMIRPIKIDFSRGFFSEKMKTFNTTWTLKFRKEDPQINENVKNKSSLFFAPLYEVIVKNEDKIVYLHRAIFEVWFEIKDKDVFDIIWKDSKIKNTFIDQQIGKILWPYIRQQVTDGMSKLMLPAVTLPLLI